MSPSEITPQAEVEQTVPVKVLNDDETKEKGEDSPFTKPALIINKFFSPKPRD